MQSNIKLFAGFILSILLLFPYVLNAQTGSNQLKQTLEKHVYTLASDSLKGRMAGSEESRLAADYIITQLEEIGLKVEVQNFSRSGLSMENLIATIEGSDPQLKDEWIVIGAHYDHIGISGNPKTPTDDVINNGADDNASGVATIIELARMFKGMEGELKRSIMFIAFDGEEQGLWGSSYFVSDPPIPLEKITVMFSLDMVGYLQTSGWLKYEGTGTIEKFNKLIADNTSADFKVKYKKFETSMMGATDTQPFAISRVPTLYVSTGLLSPYHKPADEADGIDYNGLVSVTNHVLDVVNIMANDPNVKPSGSFSPLHIASYPSIDYGVVAGIGSSHFQYRDGNIKGRSVLSYSAGLFLDANFKYFSIRPEVLYERAGSRHVGYWNPNNPNIYEPMQGEVSFDAVTVPLSIKKMPIVANAGSITIYGLYLSAGAYYRHILSVSMFGEKVASNDPRFNWNEWGITWGLGLHAFGFVIGYEAKYGLNDFILNINGNYAVRNVSSQIKLSYRF